jgi:dipeptide/tripeptide permease
MNDQPKSHKGIRSFPGQFWLVVLFEFFERGSYYGMMSFISVYFVKNLDFPKESVGVIKGVIQPLLYFLPVISGALADRFGYRKLLMIAFTLLGGGYFLTSQATQYGAVFAALVIMGFGAGIFKPLISGTIAKITDESNSTLGFGIYYWSINVGAFLFPLLLVPYLKSLNPTYVIIASAICTASMLIPTALFFKDPVKLEKIKKRDQTNLIQTLANAFEIIYSPVVLLYHQMKNSTLKKAVLGFVLIILLGFSLSKYMKTSPAVDKFPKIGIDIGETTLIFQVERDMLGKNFFKLEPSDTTHHTLSIFKPTYLPEFSDSLITLLNALPGFKQKNISEDDLEKWIQLSDQKIILEFNREELGETDFTITRLSESGMDYRVILNKSKIFDKYHKNLLKELHNNPYLSSITPDDCNKLYESTKNRPFFLLFVISLICIALIITTFSSTKSKTETASSNKIPVPFLAALALGAVIWFLPGLSLLGRIIASVIYLTVTSLFIIDSSDKAKFKDHSKFLLMIFIYSGFWVLYFQMFDSVLWYVRAYVDASSLNVAINNFLGFFGIHIEWFFDVEHVTVINAGTIILLQILISLLVRKTKALPTMMVGIALGTIGMGILAINTGIWVFIAGITIFSVGEMTAHPKFISYIGLIAPSERKGMYMGYLFLYGVFGSAIGGVVGAKLYVHFVDYLNQPRTLWLIFSGIGIYTLVALALFNRFAKPHSTSGGSAKS